MVALCLFLDLFKSISRGGDLGVSVSFATIADGMFDNRRGRWG